MSEAYIETSYRGPVGPLQHRCQQCTATGPKLLKCAGCHAARYCSREHQVADRPRHKRLCKTIKEARVETAREEHLVRTATEDDYTPANAFETAVGLFWGYKNTRDYMVARMRLAESYLLRSGSLDGVQEALDHMLDMIRLCRKDNVGLRDYVPAAMLRLDRDQDCYDFVKWWATCDPDGKYNWMDTTLPHLDLHGADVFEDPDFLMVGLPGLHHRVAILLLKLKLLVDVRKILRHHFDGSPLGTLRSPISAGLREKDEQSLAAIQNTLLAQTIKLIASINGTNKHFMADLANPHKAFISMPENYMMGSPEESALAVQSSYAAFWTTEGALETLKKIQDLKPTKD